MMTYEFLKIIDFFKKKRAMYFSKKGYELLGIETSLNYDLPNNLKFKGFIDLIIKDNIRNRIKIIDIKTPSWGWNKYAKADKKKTAQLHHRGSLPHTFRLRPKAIGLTG